MPSSASDFTRRGMAPALAVELAKQINANAGSARRLMGYGMSVVLADYIAQAINGTMAVTVEKLTSLGIHPDMAKEIVSENNEPANTVIPVISGTTAVGQALTSTPGTWSGLGPFNYARRWMRDGETISGATAASYTLVADDEDALISVEVRATNSEGQGSATSAPVGPVTA